MDSILGLLILCLLIANLIAVIFLIKRKQPDQIDNSQIFKDEVSSLKNSFSQSFGSMSKEIAKDMTGALTKVDEKVGVFNRQVSELNKSQDNFSKILSGVKTYGTLAEFGLGALLKDLKAMFLMKLMKLKKVMVPHLKFSHLFGELQKKFIKIRSL